MIKYQGKYNEATVMVDSIDQETASQIQGFLSNFAFQGGRIVVMPDCHAGKGSCVGFTAQLGDRVIPNVVGVDIGCGMLAARLPSPVTDFQQLDDWIRSHIPSGFNAHEKPALNLSWLADGLVHRFTDLAKNTGQKEGRAIESLGTLGGGNHFIEVDEAPDGSHWLVVHTGSRNLGLAVANHHQRIASILLEAEGVTGVQKGLEYLQGISALHYLDDMKTCQLYATLNRRFIMRRVMALYGEPTCDNENDLFECVHNYIDMDARIIRKGAISAKAGERVIIPLNMRDGIIIGRGKGNEAWNCSAPHGAGRILSRSQAKKRLDLQEFKDTMKGVWSSCISDATLDEAPMAYKPVETIMSVIGETVDVEFVMKPVYNFKAS